MRAVELFAGAGGLALGISRACFRHDVVIERDRHACETIKRNQEHGVELVRDWPLVDIDVRSFDYSSIPSEPDLVAGGPPCQPFSLGGKHFGPQDDRNLFPEVVRAVRELAPKAFIIENVRGLLRPAFRDYFRYVCLQLAYPSAVTDEGESWLKHLRRLDRHVAKSNQADLSYDVSHQVLNAADFGIPQKRERVFIVGFRADINASWIFPSPTHSQDALLWTQWVNGEYFERHGLRSQAWPELPLRLTTKIDLLRNSQIRPSEMPWITLRDATADLPEPHEDGEEGILNHNLNPGARTYPGHTGSSLDEPAKTLKAGDHGVPGGENMVSFPNDFIRYLTVREAARLQTFPDQYAFYGSWTENMRQLGNAVPVTLAQCVATSVRKVLEATESYKRRQPKPTHVALSST